jgi:hypothetical protein
MFLEAASPVKNKISQAILDKGHVVTASEVTTKLLTG